MLRARDRATNDFDKVELLNGHVQIGRVRVADLVEQHGTPFYVVDGSRINAQLRLLRTVFSDDMFTLFYSVKANPGLEILRRALREGHGLDACSLGDVALAKRAGASGDSISFTGAGLSADDLTWLYQEGVSVNLDSESEAVRWVAVAPRCPVGLRVVPEVVAGFHEHCRSGEWGGKFGIPKEDCLRVVRLLSKHGCEVHTLHFHLGSSIGSTAPYVEAMNHVLQLAANIHTIKTINIGGGFGAPFHPDDLPFSLNALRDQLRKSVAEFSKRFDRTLRVALEPGEFVASEAGYLVCRVRVMKRFVRDGQNRAIAITDGGMNLLPANSLYGSYLHIYVDGKADPRIAQEAVDIFGPTNQSGDTLARQRRLPQLAEGDILIIRNAGAYAYCRATRFNERPLPAEVWVEEARSWVTRQPEEIEVLFDREET